MKHHLSDSKAEIYGSLMKMSEFIWEWVLRLVFRCLLFEVPL